DPARDVGAGGVAEGVQVRHEEFLSPRAQLLSRQAPETDCVGEGHEVVPVLLLGPLDTSGEHLEALAHLLLVHGRCPVKDRCTSCLAARPMWVFNDLKIVAMVFSSRYARVPCWHTV